MTGTSEPAASKGRPAGKGRPTNGKPRPAYGAGSSTGASTARSDYAPRTGQDRSAGDGRYPNKGAGGARGAGAATVGSSGANSQRSASLQGGSGKPPARGEPARVSRGESSRGRAATGEERAYDPRREARRQMARVPLPDDVEARELDREVRQELTSLTKETAEIVAKHLVMAGRLMDDEPQSALLHARAARALAGRVGAVREANGLVAYTACEWTEALSELRAARRMTGDAEHLAVMADCERALGRPDRALLVTEDPQAAGLSPATRVELLIVASGARRDLGQADAAVVSLQVAALEGPVRPWTVRLRYAYADALLDAGREDEARQWFARAADIDATGETDAEDRMMELDGLILNDLEDADPGDLAEQAPGGAAQEPDEPATEWTHGATVGEDTAGSRRPVGRDELAGLAAGVIRQAAQREQMAHAVEAARSGGDDDRGRSDLAGGRPAFTPAEPDPTSVRPTPVAGPAHAVPSDAATAPVPERGRRPAAGTTGLGFVAPAGARGVDDGNDEDDLRLFD